MYERLLMKTKQLIVCCCLGLASFTLHADERPDHYKGKPSENLEEAFRNLTEYNDNLAKLLGSAELGKQQMHEIHQLTYTLENALQRIDKELDTAEDLLETVHLASERADVKTVREKGKSYLQQSSLLLP